MPGFSIDSHIIITGIYAWLYVYILYYYDCNLAIDCAAEIKKSPDSSTFIIGDEVKLTCTVRNVNRVIRKKLTYNKCKNNWIKLKDEV